MCSAQSTQSTLSSIQKGSLTLAASSASVSDTLTTTVDATKSFLLHSMRQNTSDPDCGLVAGELSSDGTTVTFRRDAACSISVEIEYSVVEFSSGVSVQRGSVAHNAVNPQTITLSQAVDINKSFPLIGTTNDFAEYNGADYQKIEITNENTVVISGTSSNTPTISYWQVVEFEDAIVQHGTVSFGTTDSSKTATPNNEIDPDKTWLLYSYDSGGGTDSNIGQKMIRGEITSGTQLTFDRDSTGSTANVVWYAVEFQNGTNVQSGTSNFGTSDTALTPTISTITTANSIVTAGAEFYTGGSTDHTTSDTPGHGYATLEITSSTQLTLTRAVSGSNASITWFVVDFDDSTSPITGDGVCDGSGNNYHGAVSGAVYVPPEMCVDGSCLQFDGSNDYVARNDTLDLDFAATASATITSWFRHKPQTSGTDVMVAKYESTGTDGGYKIYMDDDGDIVCGIDDENTGFPEDSVTTTGATMDDNLWHHVACVKDGTSSLKLYIDGQLTNTDSSISANTTIANDDPFYVGIDGDGTSNPWEGFIDETKVYRVALTADEINMQFVGGGNIQVRDDYKSYLTDGLVGYWKLDETSGNAADSSGNGYTLTNNGVTTYVNGKYGNGSEHVPASTQYFSTASTISNISVVSFWVNPDSTTNNYFNLTSTQYVTSSSGTLSATGFTGTFYVNGTASTTVVADTWQHVVVVLSSPINADAFYMGRAGSNYFDGTIDEVRLFNKTLSAQEIQNLYQWAPSPVGHWRFDEGAGTIAYDTSGNENHATIESYSPTDGSQVLYDTFTETSDTVITSHTPDVGTGWTQVYNNAPTAVGRVNGANDYLEATASETSVGIAYAINPAPTNSEYDISFTFKGIYTGTGTRSFNLFARQTDADNFYMVTILNGGTVTLYKVSGGTLSTLATTSVTLAVNDTFKFEVRNSAKKVFHNDTEILSSTDNALTSAGNAGLGWGYIFGKFSSHIRTEWKIDNFTVEEPSSLTDTEPAWVPAPYGYGLQLDGVNNRARIADNGILDITAGSSFTISSWFKHAEIADTSDVLLAKYNDTTGDVGYQIVMFNTGQVECKIADDVDSDFITSTDSYDDNQWHHASCVKDGNSSLKLYIDGELIGTDSTISATATLANDEPFYIGVDGGGTSGGWQGAFDDTKVYRYARTAEQVRQDMAGAIVGGGIGDPLPQPVAHWSLDEQSGQVAHSRIASLDGTLGSTSSSESSDPTWKTKANCKINGCLSFDGGDSVNMSNPASLNFERTDAFSISAWFKTSVDSSMSIVTKQSSSSPYAGYNVQTSVGGYIFFQLVNNYGTNSIEIRTTNNTNYSDGNWHHVVTTYDGSSSASGVRIYFDGISQSLTTNQDSLSSSIVTSTPLQVGSRNNAAQFFNGSIDEVKIYNSALSAYQAKLDYNTASALAISTTGDEYKDVGDGTGDPPVAYFAMDENQGLTKTVDKSGNNYEGAISSISNGGWTPGKYGSAIKLNGSDDYIDIGTGPASVKTVTFWVKPATTTEYFINLTGTSDYIWANGGTVTATGFSTPTIYVNGVATTTISAGSWQHVAVVTDTAENASNFDIGRTADTNYLEGTIDEVKLFNYALTQAQVAYDYNRGEPIGHWRLDECQGTTINDASGNDLDGTLTVTTTGGNTNGVGNCETTTSAWGTGATGKYSASLYFDGDGDYIDVGNTSRTDIYAVSFWAKPADTTESFLQLSSSDTVAVSSGTITVGGFGTETVYVDGIQTTSFPDNSWHHVTVVSNSALTANDMDIGRVGTTYYSGQIDDVQIFNYALSANQVRKLYNASSAVRFE